MRIRALTRDVDAATRQLTEANNELESRVTERTTELCHTVSRLQDEVAETPAAGE